MVDKDQSALLLEMPDLESIHGNNVGSNDGILPGRSSTDSALIDSGGGLKAKSRGELTDPFDEFLGYKANWSFLF